MVITWRREVPAARGMSVLIVSGGLRHLEMLLEFGQGLRGETLDIRVLAVLGFLFEGADVLLVILHEGGGKLSVKCRAAQFRQLVAPRSSMESGSARRLCPRRWTGAGCSRLDDLPQPYQRAALPGGSPPFLAELSECDFGPAVFGRLFEETPIAMA